MSQVRDSDRPTMRGGRGVKRSEKTPATPTSAESKPRTPELPDLPVQHRPRPGQTSFLRRLANRARDPPENHPLYLGATAGREDLDGRTVLANRSTWTFYPGSGKTMVIAGPGSGAADTAA